MALNVPNPNERLPADYLHNPQSMQRVFRTRNWLLIEILLLLTMFERFTTWDMMVTHISKGTRNQCIL